MRNLHAYRFATLGGEVHSLADLEARYLARRIELQEQAAAAILVGRAKSILAQGKPWYGDRYAPWPRCGKGRYLSRAWLDQAETFTPADLAWFRSPAR